jgi:hypothetical protein
MFKTRYRIVTDSYAGYEAQVRYWWFPFWVQLTDTFHRTNTHSYVADAEALIQKHIRRSSPEYRPGRIVKYVEPENENK